MHQPVDDTPVHWGEFPDMRYDYSTTVPLWTSYGDWSFTGLRRRSLTRHLNHHTLQAWRQEHRRRRRQS